MRSSLSITVLAAAAAASLLATPRLAAQSTAPSTERPVVASSDLEQEDAVNMRRLVDEEARHRDRVARLARLRTLAEQRGQTQRLAELDRLDRLETDRFEARTLIARSRMSDPALRQADDFVRRGGVMKMRRVNQSVETDADRTRRPGRNSAAERAGTERKAKTSTRPGGSRTQPTRSGSSSRGGTSSGGRSPR